MISLETRVYVGPEEGISLRVWAPLTKFISGYATVLQRFCRFLIRGGHHMGHEIDIIPSDEVSSSHKVCDYLEPEGFIETVGGDTFYLADYCGLGHLCDEIGDCMSDWELALECNHCFFVEFDDGDVVYRELHTKDQEAFKSELRERINTHLAASS